MKKAILTAAFCLLTALAVATHAGARAAALTAAAAEPQSACPFILTEPVVTVAPNQPEVEPHSTVGIINALCDVKLDFAGCGFTPTTIKITCDTNGDGAGELIIPLTDITIVNRLLLQATIPALSPQLPGSPFPLACCGGVVNITLSRTVTEGDDNVFGDFTQTLTCQIDLGVRAPVVISASPSSGDCSAEQDMVIPGSCFLLAGGKPNVTSVFAVERGNPNNVIQSKRFVILNTNLIDALFDFGAPNAGKTFLIFASGPNGTSRNLTGLPPGARADCPLGNEQGVMVTFTCKGASADGGKNPQEEPPSGPIVNACSLSRDPTGTFVLDIFGRNFLPGAAVNIGGITPKKVQFKDAEPGNPGAFTRIKAKKGVCRGIPGIIIVSSLNRPPSTPFFCHKICPD
ncbi:MAG TPA: hypothetical protein VJZ26_12230 [Blastocatellia bacterium]|nr:hypothetical protein [Blastocatellia bacterium]